MYLYGSFISQRGAVITVRIVTNGDRSEEVEIGADGGNVFFADDPVEIENEVNDTFDHLLRQSASIRLLTREYLPDLFCTSCTDVVVNILKDDVCIFAGYVEPQVYSQGYNEALDELELSCIDVLSALQYSKYRGIGGLGNVYETIRAEAGQRTFYNIITEMLDTLTASVDLSGSGTVRYLYDGSKSLDDGDEGRYTIFSVLSVSELLFLGEEEDDVWQQDEVLDEILRFLNLHIVQDGLDFYIFSWESVKGSDALTFREIVSEETEEVTPEDIAITLDNVADAGTQISVGEVYNQILLTCEVESVESVIESPLDDDALISPFSNKQKYMTEYSSPGEGRHAYDAFYAMLHDESTDFDKATITEWFIQIMNNESWTFNIQGQDISSYLTGKNQQNLPNAMRQAPANRIGFAGNGGPYSLLQLKVMQEVISLTVFTVFTVVFFSGEALHWNHFVSFLLLIAAVWFAFLK